MKKILSAIQTALQKIDSFPERRHGLEAEQRELKAKIPSLTVAVGGGDTKRVNELAVARARLELIPQHLEELRLQYGDMLNELRSHVADLSPALAEIYNKTRERIDKSAREFLKKLLENEYHVNEIARQITTNSRELSELYKFKVVFEGAYIFNMSDPNLVKSRAEYALANLKKYE